MGKAETDSRGGGEGDVNSSASGLQSSLPASTSSLPSPDADADVLKSADGEEKEEELDGRSEATLHQPVNVGGALPNSAQSIVSAITAPPGLPEDNGTAKKPPITVTTSTLPSPRTIVVGDMNDTRKSPPESQPIYATTDSSTSSNSTLSQKGAAVAGDGDGKKPPFGADGKPSAAAVGVGEEDGVGEKVAEAVKKGTYVTPLPATRSHTQRTETDDEKIGWISPSTTQDNDTEELRDGSGANYSIGEEEVTIATQEPLPGLQPGAYRVYPSNPGHSSPPPEEDIVNMGDYRWSGADHPPNYGANAPPLEAESQHLDQSGDIVAEAYTVEEQEPSDLPSATVVDTCFGIERKRLIIIASVSVGAIAIVLGCVLGIAIPRSKSGQEKNVCGSLCGTEEGVVDEGLGVPYPSRKVFDLSCSDWDVNSATLPKPKDGEGTCAEQYDPAAYGCGCEGVEVPENGCGNLCTDGSELPDPDLLVIDINFNGIDVNNQGRSCLDWQLKSQFDTDPNECVNYNAIGAMCGCPNNEPHPDACGPLCGEGKMALHSEQHPVWHNTCRQWNIMSTYLPIWYANDDNESCQEYYQDPVYGCACPEVTTPPIRCGKLCQDRRVCEPICSNGASPPDPNFVARRETCAGWELWSRTEVHQTVCPLYHLTGAMCGCDNEPPADACGPLCPNGKSMADPDRLVAGQSCSDWNDASMFLPSSYDLYQDGNGGLFRTCSDFYDRIAHGCGCEGVTPPTDGCGSFCEDGSSIPEPDKLVGGRTCRDLEINSLFETDKNQCTFYNAIAKAECGCSGGVEYTEECFEMEHLQNQTYYHSANGNSFYTVEFRERGIMAAIISSNNFVTLGHFNGIEDGVASFGGGTPCGVYGPRTGIVQIVEDELVTEPTFGDFYEPSICIAKAVLRVPKFCSKDAAEQVETPPNADAADPVFV